MFRAAPVVGMIVLSVAPDSMARSAVASRALVVATVLCCALLALVGSMWVAIRALRLPMTLFGAWNTHSPEGTLGSAREIAAAVYVLQALPLLAAGAGPNHARAVLFVMETAFCMALLVVARNRGLLVIPGLDGLESRASGLIRTLAAGTVAAGGSLLFAYSFFEGRWSNMHGMLDVLELLVLSPVILELVYRVGLQRILSSAGRPVAAVALASVCFMLYHGDFATYPDQFVFSIFAGTALLATASIWSSVIAHALGNAGLWGAAPLRHALMGSASVPIPSLIGYSGAVVALLVLVAAVRRARPRTARSE
jgi:membrane protease YdiL (CAAX protease family)